jgi:Methyltransferase domain
MALTTKAKDQLNKLLRKANLQLSTLTSERAELMRLAELERRGHFARPVLPTLRQIEACDPRPIFEQLHHDAPRFRQSTAEDNATGFVLNNHYFTSPDAEVLYSMVRMFRPRTIVEVGSGNSTRLIRLAIADEELPTRVISIDPCPRIGVVDHATEVLQTRVEDLTSFDLFESLGANDILFVDSSHEIKAGNDVLFLMFSVMPRLPAGVLIHFHDIPLPYEYPRYWLIERRWNWTEAYLLQALLTDNPIYEVLWPGYYLQRAWPNFASAFENWRDSPALSFWLRKR